MIDLTPQQKDARERLHWGAGRIAFFAHQERIKQLLAEGYPQLVIHQKLHEELSELSYSQFSRLIRKYIFRRSKAAEPAMQKTINASNNQSPSNEFKLPSVFRGFVPGPKVPDLNELF